MKSLIKKILTFPIIMNLFFYTTNLIQIIFNLFIKSSVGSAVTVITFDDGLSSVYENAYPIMKKYGVVGNVAVILDSVGKDGFMSLEQLQELQSEGWCICSHTMSHPDITKLSDEKLYYELTQSKERLKALGFSGYHSFVVPFHYHDQVSMSKVRQIYKLSRNQSHKGMRILGRFGIYFLPDMPLNDYHALPSLPIEDFYGVNQGVIKIENYIKHSVMKRKYGALYTHGLETKDIYHFEKVVKSLSEHPEAITTFEQLISII